MVLMLGGAITPPLPYEAILYTHIIGTRLQDMAKGSVLVWLQKISHDLSLYLQGSKQKLNDKLETLKGNNEG